MAGRATKGKGLAGALSLEIEAAISKVAGAGKLPTSKDVKKLTAALRSLNKMLKKLSAGTPGRKAAAAAPGQKRKGRKPTATSCSVAGCVRPHYAKGLCASHYNSALRIKKLGGKKTPGKPGPKPKKRGRPGPKPKAVVVKARRGPKPGLKTCSVAGCSNKHYAKGMCKQHYAAKQYANKQKAGK